jgi:hypothetical protein
VIHVDLNSSDPVLVAEGYMELDSWCVLRLTYTTDYFQDEAPVKVEDATVILSDDDGNSETLSHLGDGLYRGQHIVGKESTRYTLSIETDEQVNEGFSTLPAIPVFDTVSLEEFPFGGPHPSEDFPKILTISFKSVPGTGHYYLLELTLNGERMEDYFALASNEFAPDAETVDYTTVMFPSEDGDGDTLSMEVFAIDQDTYRYYSQMNEAIGNGFAMSSTPYNPASNLGEDILGYFIARSRFDTTLVLR